MKAKRIFTEAELTAIRAWADDDVPLIEIAKRLGIGDGTKLLGVIARHEQLRDINFKDLPRRYPPDRGPDIVDTEPEPCLPSKPGPKKKTITPAQRGWVRRWAQDGHSDTAIASKLGMDRGTFKRLLERDDATKLAYDQGRGQLETDLTTLMIEQGKQGRIAGPIFVTKNLFGWSDNKGPLVEIDASDRRVQVVSMPQAASEDAFAKLISQFQQDGGALPGTVADDTPHERQNDAKTPLRRMVRRHEDDE